MKFLSLYFKDTMTEALQDDILTLSKSRQYLFIVKTVSKNRRKRPHFMKLLHPWKGKEKHVARKEILVLSQSVSLIV